MVAAGLISIYHNTYANKNTSSTHAHILISE